jgi:hypothetical protein
MTPSPALAAAYRRAAPGASFSKTEATRQLITIGRYPTITLSQARDEAKRLLAERTLGKHRPRNFPWEHAEKRFLADCEQRVANGDLKTRTLADYTRLLKKYFAFERRQLSDITTETSSDASTGS